MHSFRKILTLAATTFVATSTFTFAEDAKPAAPGEGGARPGGERRYSAEERLKVMSEKLSLTTEQQAKIKAIFEKNAEPFKAIMSKGRPVSEEDRTKLQELFKKQSEEVNAVLTPEQQEKAKQLRPRRGEGRKPEGDGAKSEGAKPEASKPAGDAPKTN